MRGNSHDDSDWNSKKDQEKAALKTPCVPTPTASRPGARSSSSNTAPTIGWVLRKPVKRINNSKCVTVRQLERKKRALGCRGVASGKLFLGRGGCRSTGMFQSLFSQSLFVCWGVTHCECVTRGALDGFV